MNYHSTFRITSWLPCLSSMSRELVAVQFFQNSAFNEDGGSERYKVHVGCSLIMLQKGLKNINKIIRIQKLLKESSLILVKIRAELKNGLHVLWIFWSSFSTMIFCWTPLKVSVFIIAFATIMTVEGEVAFT